MIPHFHFRKVADMKALAGLQEQYKRHGGKVVLFPRVTSVILVSWETTHLEWVPPYAARAWSGLKYALWSAILGWWSLDGLWCAPASILTSLFGGVDVTELVAAPGLMSSNQQHAVIRSAHTVLENRERYMLVVVLILLIAAIMAYIAVSPTVATRALQKR